VPATTLANPPDVSAVLDRLSHRYPTRLVDAVTELEPGRRAVGVKSVTVNQDFFQGHFPRRPVMPGVLMMDALAQLSTVMLLQDADLVVNARVELRGMFRAKFRRQVGPGDRLELEVTSGRRRGPLVRVRGEGRIDGQTVVEVDLLLAVIATAATIHPTAIVHPAVQIGAGSVVGAYTTIGPNVRIGRNNRIGPSCVIDGWTEIGDNNTLNAFGSFGLPPQDLKYRGEMTRLSIGHGNTFREHVAIHRGTKGGGGHTTIGDRNYFMAYSHVAHDCHVGNETIFANGATLAGHVDVDDFATVGAYSGVHQFCRVGKHAFIGGFSVCTKDVLPYSKTVGNRARIYSLNTIGLVRRGFPSDVVRKLKSAYRVLLQSKLNTTRAVARISAEPELDCAEVRYMVDFIRSAKRGVVLKHTVRRSEDSSGDE
jgi:UDP-N-acetylglucosamine acyltransferase